jgi:hypothetical protein
MSQIFDKDFVDLAEPENNYEFDKEKFKLELEKYESMAIPQPASRDDLLKEGAFHFYKNHKKDFPNMVQLASVLLIINVSSVPSERLLCWLHPN